MPAMKNSGDPPQEAFIGIVGYWRRVPVIIRATFLGILVSSVGVYSWLIVGALIPAPWSGVIMGIILVLYVIYFSGNGGPKFGLEARRISFRSIKPSTNMWKWGLFAAILIVALWQSSLVLTFRIFEFPQQVMVGSYDLAGMPVWVAWLMVMMASLVAGICEETGYRGYMQVPLENRFGPVPAIGLVSLLFLIIHLQQVWTAPLLLHLFALSVLLGILSYASGSLIPSIVAHFGLDIFNFSYWWTDLAGSYNRRPFAETGIDAHFLIWGLLFILSVILFLWTIQKVLTVAAPR
jgi:membrane protease YdiL (CAAX protease family)